eukprot:2161718-Prymnesium_polylepis.1
MVRERRGLSKNTVQIARGLANNYPTLVLIDSDGNRLVGPRTNRVNMVGAHAKLEGAGLRHYDDTTVSDRLLLVPNPIADFIAVVQHYVLDIDERRWTDVIKDDEHTADAGVRGSVRRHEGTVGEAALARLNGMHGAVRRLKKALRCRMHAIQVVDGPAILLLGKLGIVFKKESVV